MWYYVHHYHQNFELKIVKKKTIFYQFEYNIQKFSNRTDFLRGLLKFVELTYFHTKLKTKIYFRFFWANLSISLTILYLPQLKNIGSIR